MIAKKIYPFFILFFLSFGLISLPACSRKSGCPAETATTKADKHGNFKVKKPKSGLFPKNAGKKK
jgi:hypothetical protein